MYFAHAVRRQVLLEIRSGGEGFLAKLTLPRLALVVDAFYVDPHVVSAHELFVTMRTGHIGDTRRHPTLLTTLCLSLGLDSTSPRGLGDQ